MMEEWRKYLAVIAGSATDEQVSKVIKGWEEYFASYGITDPDEQGRELRAHLRIRVATIGSISIRAPGDFEPL
jgi:5S rRNA maturation endonuclease (ribonuclease M5)